MNRLTSILMVGFAITAVSCMKETTMENPVEKTTENNSIGTITKAEALNYLDRLLQDLYGVTKSRAPEYDKDNVEVLTKEELATTKAGATPVTGTLTDTVLYIVNFKDNNGYAILSAMTSAANPVFCVTEAGQISPEDFMAADEYLQSISPIDEPVDNITNDPYFNDMGKIFVPAAILSKIYSGDLTIKLPDDDEEDGGNDQHTRLYDTVVVSKVGPFLETKWTQWSPFNDFLNNPDIPAGCVAIATAQILAYNEVAPKDNFDEHPYDWDLMKTVYNYKDINHKGSSEAQKLVSAFAKEVGKRENCRIRYRKNGSYGYADGAKRTFKNYGYKNVHKYINFNKRTKEQVINQIKRGLPVYIDAWDARFSGHAWVIDGLFVRNIYYASTGKLKEQQNMFHCNWGWNGTSDGYYIQGIFDTSERIDEDEIDTAPSDNYKPGNYVWHYRPITYSL